MLYSNLLKTAWCALAASTVGLLCDVCPAQVSVDNKSGSAITYSLEDVLAGVESYRRKLQRSQYEYTSTQVLHVGPRGRIDSSAFGWVIRRDDHLATYFELDVSLVDQHIESQSMRESVTNDAYSISNSLNPNVTSIPHMFTHDDASAMCEAERRFMQTARGMDPLQLAGSLDGGQTLPEAVKRFPASEWVVEQRIEDGSDVVVELSEYHTWDGQRRLRRQIDLAPDKGWVITRVRKYKDGELGLERVTRYERHEGGPWLPVEIDEQAFAVWFNRPDELPELNPQPERSRDGRLILKRLQFQLSNVQLMDDIPQETFTLANMSIEEGQPVAWKSCDDTLVMYQYVNGELILLNHPVRPEAPAQE